MIIGNFGFDVSFNLLNLCFGFSGIIEFDFSVVIWVIILVLNVELLLI